MRQKFVAGNWKMYTTAAGAQELAKGVVQKLGSEARVTVAVCPPFPYLARVAEVLRGSSVGLGGRNATPDQAQAAHAFLRQRVGQLVGVAAAQALVIQYGGSVKPDNAASLLGQPDVDGALVGGASLNADQFLAIVRAGV